MSPALAGRAWDSSFDLLTEEEEKIDEQTGHLRFNISQSHRLADNGLATQYFGFLMRTTITNSALAILEPALALQQLQW